MAKNTPINRFWSELKEFVKIDFLGPEAPKHLKNVKKSKISKNSTISILSDFDHQNEDSGFFSAQKWKFRVQKPLWTVSGRFWTILEKSKKMGPNSGGGGAQICRYSEFWEEFFFSGPVNFLKNGIWKKKFFWLEFGW